LARGIRSIVVMGVSGSGKSSVASALAQRSGREFVDADWLHTSENLALMSSGHALDDEQRLPWLSDVGELMRDMQVRGQRPVVACSALKRAYRDKLREYVPELFVVFLDGSKRIVEERIGSRHHDFMPASLLDSQLAILEDLGDDERGMRIDISASVDELVEEIEARLGQ
jgi:carbohydrate kinase (thermoresistant glucokinase family)